MAAPALPTWQNAEELFPLPDFRLRLFVQVNTREDPKITLVTLNHMTFDLICYRDPMA